MDFDENDAEYFEFVHQKPLLQTIYESKSFHSDHDPSCYNNRHYHRHDHHHHHKRLQLIKFLSLFILQYAVVSLMFQYQWNLQNPPKLPAEYYQVDDDIYMHQSFVQTTSKSRTIRGVLPVTKTIGNDESKTDVTGDGIIKEQQHGSDAPATTAQESPSTTGPPIISSSMEEDDEKLDNTEAVASGEQEEPLVESSTLPTIPVATNVRHPSAATSSSSKKKSMEMKEDLSNQTTPTTQMESIPSINSNSNSNTSNEQTEILQVRSLSLDHIATEAPTTTPDNKTNHHPKEVQPLPPTVPLNLIPKPELNFYDYFSDSWLIPKENFMQLNTTHMNHVEQACFQAIRRPGFYVHPTSKMFVDWTDFMVEHMSKWWGVFRIAKDPDPTMFQHVISIFDKYLIQKASAYNNNNNKINNENNEQLVVVEDEGNTEQQQQQQQLPPLHRTLAMVAFREYQTKLNPERGPILTSHTLAATLASLVPMGFGRILVVGYEPDDRTRVFEALEILEASYKGAILIHPKHSNTFSLTIGYTEFAYAKIPHVDWVKTKAYEVNVPRGVIRGVQLSIQGQLPQAEEWLGHDRGAEYWKYFYLTEPDTFLHTKPELLPSIREGLDRGLSFFPHRVQPIPHERDLPPEKNLEREDEDNWKLPFDVVADDDGEQEASTNDPEKSHKHFSDNYAGMYLPGNILPFSNITIISDYSSSSSKNDQPGDDDNEVHHCCDGGKGWPGRSLEFGDTGHMPCNGKSWWACGFVGVGRYRSNDKFLELHKRLIPYPLMSLAQGTGVVFGPTNAGRRCFPSKSPCPTGELHVLNKKPS